MALSDHVLKPVTQAAMYDNMYEDRREFWRLGQCCLMVTREILDAPEYMDHLIAEGRAPDELRTAWVPNRILGNVEHIPLPYRP